MMKPVKLPRKRKKAFIKAEGAGNYVADQIAGRILCEYRPGREKHYRKFPRKSYVRMNVLHVTKWW